jgi:hypothetical protein
MHELETLVGELIRDHVKDIMTPWGVAVGKKLGDKAFEHMAKDLTLKGAGYAAVERKGDLVTWKIHNPFYTPILEGKLAGVFQGAIGHKPDVHVEKDENLLTLHMD